MIKHLKELEGLSSMLISLIFITFFQLHLLNYLLLFMQLLQNNFKIKLKFLKHMILILIKKQSKQKYKQIQILKKIVMIKQQQLQKMDHTVMVHKQHYQLHFLLLTNFHIFLFIFLLKDQIQNKLNFHLMFHFTSQNYPFK